MKKWLIRCWKSVAELIKASISSIYIKLGELSLSILKIYIEKGREASKIYKIYIGKRAWEPVVVELILESIPNIKKEPLIILNQSSYVYRPDFILEEEGKKFIIEIKPRKIEPRDAALIKGIVSGLNAQPIFISPEEPDEKTRELANKSGIRIISGSPDTVVEKLRRALLKWRAEC